MARFLSPDWIAAVNAALDGTVLPSPGPDAGLAAQDGRFTVAQEVRGGPDGHLRMLMTASEGSLVLSLVDPDGDTPPADVTISLDYADAISLSQGSLSPAEALTAGRIRVRGDLSVLAAGQAMLSAARSCTQDVYDATTY